MRVTAAAMIWFVVTFFSSLPAHAAEPTYLPSANGCRVFDQSPRVNEVVTWSGGCKDGLADGIGKVEWLVDGKVTSTEEGMFKNGKLNGHGVIHYSSGEVYDGELVDGQWQGHGIRTAADGTRREGEFDHGKPAWSPAMKVWYANFNERLSDALEHAKRPTHQGTVVIESHLDANNKVTAWQVKTSSGSEEVDSYIVDAANRIAELPVTPAETSVVSFSYRYSPRGAVLEAPVQPLVITLVADANGCQAESLQTNPGKTISWTGACKDGFLDGPGVVTWPDAQGGPYSIEATFAHGQAQGHAIVNFPNHARYEGELTHNSVTGVGIMSYATGDRYEGDLVDGRPQGQGKLVYANHASYAGGWYQGLHSGPGDYVDEDGGRFQGTFLKNVRIGYGILDPHGRVRYAGRFVDDKPTGSVSFGIRYGGPEPSLVDYRPINLQVESYKTYKQLSQDEKAKVNAQYSNLPQGDEPPYPAHGLLPIYHELLRLESFSLMSGVFSIVVHVDATGLATNVDVVSSPDDDLSKEAINFVLRQDFKPAQCHATPCEMTFPLSVALDH